MLQLMGGRTYEQHQELQVCFADNNYLGDPVLLHDVADHVVPEVSAVVLLVRAADPHFLKSYPHFDSTGTFRTIIQF